VLRGEVEAAGFKLAASGPISSATRRTPRDERIFQPKVPGRRVRG